MSDLRDLYQETILDHGKNPRNRGRIDGPTHSAEGYNPLCGDRLTLDLVIEDDRVQRVAFEGAGCAISMASASMMSQAVQGLPLTELEALFVVFQDVVTGRLDPTVAGQRLGKLVVFAGVREFPVRVKCATLPWHTLRAALSRRGDPVTTE